MKEKDFIICEILTNLFGNNDTIKDYGRICTNLICYGESCKEPEICSDINFGLLHEFIKFDKNINDDKLIDIKFNRQSAIKSKLFVDNLLLKIHRKNNFIKYTEADLKHEKFELSVMNKLINEIYHIHPIKKSGTKKDKS